MNAPFVEVKLTVDHMRTSIVHCLSAHLKTIQDSMQREVDLAVERFDFASEVQRIAAMVVGEIVERTVRDAITLAMWSEPLNAIVSHAVTEAVRKAVGGKP